MSLPTQTSTPFEFAPRPSKTALAAEYKGKTFSDLRTPAFVIDRSVFAQNCARMHERAKEWGAGFRAHLKTHKTTEGTRLQLVSSADKTDRVVVSTLMEAWEVVNAGLVKDGTVKDLLYGLPAAINKIADLSTLWDEMAKDGGVVRLMIDHPEQVEALEQFEKERGGAPRRWSAFVKVDGGQKRAGVSTATPYFATLLEKLITSPVMEIYGFYAHAGNAYASTSLDQATSFLSSEVEAVNTAAKLATDIIVKNAPAGVRLKQPEFILSVGSTPTAHAASAETRKKLDSLLHGKLELHAGNYPMLDLQQISTSLVPHVQVAQKIITTVISLYPGRGVDGTDEGMCDAGAIALSKDTGPSGTFGEVVGRKWKIGRMSQEHGLLVDGGDDPLKLGEVLEVVGQHACLIAAAYPYYFIVDSSEGDGKSVVDVWVPWKGW